MHNTVSNFCQIHPKVSYYHSDGQGRDTYILYNNGGLVVEKRTLSPFPKAKFESSPTKHLKVKPSNSNCWPKVSYYQPDGSGRDTYIKQSEGGFHLNSLKGGLRYQCKKFMKTLCSY